MSAITTPTYKTFVLLNKNNRMDLLLVFGSVCAAIIIMAILKGAVKKEVGQTED